MIKKHPYNSTYLLLNSLTPENLQQEVLNLKSEVQELKSTVSQLQYTVNKIFFLKQAIK
jgi:hypothetical protein